MNSHRLSRLFLVVLLIASGCVKVGPDFVKPEAAVAPNWLETGDNRVQTGPPNYRNWWQIFNDPILNRLIDTTYHENLTLRIAGVRVLGARAQLGIAVGEVYPQTQQALGSVIKNRLSETAATTAPGSPVSFWQSTLGLTASWEIDFWGKFRRAIESADAGLLAAVADYDNTLVSLTADVGAAYILIRTLEKRLDIARRNVEVQKESLQIATARFEGGTTSERDVEQAKTVLASTQATIPTLETQLRQTKNALCVLLGLAPNNLSELLGSSITIPAPPPQVAVGIPADLLRRRPDIQRAEYRAGEQCARIGVAKANLYPAFSLTGSFGFLASDVGSFALGDMFRWQSRTGSFGPSFQWNILNYGQITNLVRVQDARFQELLIAYQDTVLRAQQEVEDGLIGFLKSQERANFLVQSTAAAQRSVDLAILQYREGITDFTTVLTAEQNLLTQQNDLATTLGDISRNLVAVYRALGGGWQMREEKDFVPDSIKATMAARTNWGKLLAPAAHTPPPPEQPRSLIRAPDW
ncbi:MAG: efflux transporter outer membrane subunit [Deltaproteobacteria bacterium]|nr:efflux transporter outer membrane subunit [Deltaproteobacteria bacterium]